MRFYPIGVAEKGFIDYRFTVHGTWGHGRCRGTTTPRSGQPASSIGIADPGPPRLTPVMDRFFEAVRTAAPSMARVIDALTGPDPRRADAAVDALCNPMNERVANALLRDTISPNVIRAGIKHNVIPGEAVIEIDCPAPAGHVRGDDAAGPPGAHRRGTWATLDVEIVVIGRPGRGARRPRPLPDHGGDAARPRSGRRPRADHGPVRDRREVHRPKLGVPTYGFSPLRLDPEERFLERFHGVDERVSLDAPPLRLPVLYDVVRRYCG